MTPFDGERRKRVLIWLRVGGQILPIANLLCIPFWSIRSILRLLKQCLLMMWRIIKLLAHMVPDFFKVGLEIQQRYLFWRIVILAGKFVDQVVLPFIYVWCSNSLCSFIYCVLSNTVLQLLVMELPSGLYALFMLGEFWRGPFALKLVHLIRSIICLYYHWTFDLVCQMRFCSVMWKLATAGMILNDQITEYQFISFKYSNSDSCLQPWTSY